MHSKSEFLGKQPVGKLLTRLSLPAITAMLVMSLYNIADTIFVGQAVGAAAIGGLGIVFPLQTLFMALGTFFGVGGASLYSRALGARDGKTAEKTLGNTICGAILTGVVLMVVTILAQKPLLHLFGARDAVLSRFAGEYFSIIVLGIPFISMLVAGNSIIRAAGHAKTAMVTMLISALLNIILDPILIIGFKMGVRGAALATVISQAVTAIWILWYFRSRHSAIRLTVGSMKPDFSIIRDSAAVGLSSFVQQTAMSVELAIFNNLFLMHGGVAAVSMFSTVFRPISIAIMPLLGLAQALQPIAGYNYGAGRIERVRQTFSLSWKIASLLATVAAVLFLVFPESIIRIFIKKSDLTKNPGLITMGAEMIRYIQILFPLAGYQIMSGALFQALGSSVSAFVTSIARQLLFLIPVGVILSRFWGLHGILASFPVAEVLGFLLALFLMKKEHKQLRMQEA